MFPSRRSGDDPFRAGRLGRKGEYLLPTKALRYFTYYDPSFWNFLARLQFPVPFNLAHVHRGDVHVIAKSRGWFPSSQLQRSVIRIQEVGIFSTNHSARPLPLWWKSGGWSFRTNEMLARYLGIASKHRGMCNRYWSISRQMCGETSSFINPGMNHPDVSLCYHYP